MKTKNMLLGMVAVALSAVLTGCYEKFDTPPAQKIYDDTWFADNDFQKVSIADIKQLFVDKVGDPTNTATYGKGYNIVEPYYIMGKVISNDAFGNFYRNLYIQDDTGGIEVKVGLTGMYTKYVTGETIYVICQDLNVGNYRRNLSLGLEDLSADYANKNIEVKYLVDVHLKQGERTAMAKADTIVINSSNISQYVSGSNNMFSPAMSGRLVRFEGALSTWGTFSGNSYPAFQLSAEDGYASVLYTDLFAQWDAYDAAVAAGQAATEPSVPRPGNFYYDPRVPTWAYQEYMGSARYYGSARFTVGSVAIVIRTSGYSRFALDPVPADGRIVDMTGIINLYTSGSGGFATNQFMLNNSSDVY